MESKKNRTKNYNHITEIEREKIELLLQENYKKSQIAKKIGRSKSTIGREIIKNSPRINNCKYRANRAQKKADERRKKSSKHGHLSDLDIQKYVINKLAEHWSPEQIAGRLSIDLPKKKTNYETIYLFVYKQRSDLIQNLRFSHRKRKKRTPKRVKNATKIPNRTPIEERMLSANNRSRIGHWETDTMVSRQSKAVIQVSIERKTRFAQIAKLEGKTAEEMSKSLNKKLGIFGCKLVKSITYDNGTENAYHEKTNHYLGTKSFFCNPYHSWEKGSVENLIGLVRNYLPKKTDLAIVSLLEIRKIEEKLNNRPRKCLNYQTPKEEFDKVALHH